MTRRAAASPKIQRWIDLIAALLLRHCPISFEELVSQVPAYQATKSPEARRRTFERDKDELRDYGVPIDTRRNAEGEVIGYRLDRRQFYLPYLALQLQDRPAGRQKPAKHGYRDLASLAFDSDELAAIADAAALVRDVGDPVLAEAAGSAMRKLAFDLPVDSVRADDDLHVVRPRREPDPEVFERLTSALERRKLVSFAYHTIGRDETRRRSVEPWGLFFLGQHWYLSGRDTEANGLRNFRLSRMSQVEVNARRAQSPDFAIPAAGALRAGDRALDRGAGGAGAGCGRIGDGGPAARRRGLGSAARAAVWAGCRGAGAGERAGGDQEPASGAYSSSTSAKREVRSKAAPRHRRVRAPRTTGRSETQVGYDADG